MMVVWMETLLERLRRVLLGDLREVVRVLWRDVQQMRGAIERQRDTVHDPAMIKTLVSAALSDEMRRGPDDLIAALTPIVERLVRASLPAPPAVPAPAVVRAQSPRARRWTVPVAAAVVAFLLIPRVTVVSEATVDSAPPAIAPRDVSAIASITVPHPKPVTLEERSDGFGLGEASISDDELARQVRARLVACGELADAQVSFSVKDGWVWLRGAASADGRKAAEEVLRDLPPGAFVVNQLAAAAAEKAVAER